MRTRGSAAELERRRWLAVQRVLEGYSTEEIADFLGIDARSVRRWLQSYRENGVWGLVAHPVPGRPCRLTYTQEKIVLRWVLSSPCEQGFGTELWTGRHLAELIEQVWGIHFHPRYLSGWLRARGFTPQKPQRKARESSPEAISSWLATQWPRIKKKRIGAAPI